MAGAVLTLAGTAQARTAQPAERLRLQEHDTGSAGWQRHVSDSPADMGAQRVKLAVAEQTGDDYVVAVAPRSNVRGPIDEVGHFGFDVLTRTYVGAGAPRISVELDTDGDSVADVYAYLSAQYCKRNYTGSDWARSNFYGPEVRRPRVLHERHALHASDEHRLDERVGRLRRGTPRRRGPGRVHGAGRGRSDLRRPDRDRAPHVHEREPGA